MLYSGLNSAFFHSPSPGPHWNVFSKTRLPSASTTNRAEAETVSTCSRNSVAAANGPSITSGCEPSFFLGLSSVPLGGRGRGHWGSGKWALLTQLAL